MFQLQCMEHKNLWNIDCAIKWGFLDEIECNILRKRLIVQDVLYLWSCVTENAARETLEQVMAEALLKAGMSHSAVRAVCLGVSGVNHPTDQEMILNWIRCFVFE